MIENDAGLLRQIQAVKRKIAEVIEKCKTFQYSESKIKPKDGESDALTAELRWLMFVEAIYVETRKIYPDTARVGIRFVGDEWEITILGKNLQSIARQETKVNRIVD